MEKKYPWNHSRSGKKGKEPVTCVYAGPEFFEQKSPSPMEGVYAGPDYPQQPIAPPNPHDDPAVPDDPAPVYAGPTPPVSQTFMATYAAPVPPGPAAGAFLDTSAIPAPRRADGSSLFCPECGTPAAADAKYCSECGHKLKP